MIGAIEQVTPGGTEGISSHLHSLLAAVALLTVRADWAEDLVGLCGKRIGCCWLYWRLRLKRWWLELLAKGDEGSAITAAEAAVATRLGKSFRKYVNRPVANELDTCLLYVKLTLGAVLASRSGFEGDDSIVTTDQSPVGDRTTGHVAGQVF
jgi:hypothetical protein